MTNFQLGRIHRLDKRDTLYPMKKRFSLLERVKHFFVRHITKKGVEWITGPVLDQGQTPHCVGYATRQYLATKPANKIVPSDVTGDEIYYDCKIIDKEPKAEDGTDARSAMKVMVNEGFVTTYVWANKASDISGWLLTKGPVLCGTPWHQDMFSPDSNGIVHPTGSIAGGHEYLAHGFNPRTKLVKCVNSWGVGWGIQGHFYISLPDLWKLIQEGGDAVAPTE